MSKMKGFRLIAGVIVLGLFNICAYANPHSIDYIQLSSNKSQAAEVENNLVSFEQVDGVLALGAQHRVIVKVDGVYFVMVSAQIGAVKDAKENGFVDLWLNKNDKPIIGTNARLSVIQDSTGVLVSQVVLNLKKGDTISVGFGANNPIFGLLAIPKATNGNVIPSVIFTLYKI